MSDTKDEPVKVHRLGESTRYSFADATCVGCACFEPVVMCEVGSNLEHASCRSRFVLGCPPKDERLFSLGTSYRRSRDGWRIDP